MTDSWDAMLFDLDGTLADSIELILSSFRHTMRRHLGTVPPDQLWIEGLGTPLDQQLRTFARDDAESIAMRTTYRSYQHTVHDQMVRPYEGVVETLEVLRARRVPLAVVTSKHLDMAMRTMRVCGIDHHFDFVITPEHVARGKPHPDPVLAALARLSGGHASRTVFVGDAPADLQAGRAAGVRTAAACWGPFPVERLRVEQPDYLLSRFDELTHLMP